MSNSSSVSYWEDLHAKVSAVGPVYLLRAGLTKLVRPAMTGWRRLRCQVRPLRRSHVLCSPRLTHRLDFLSIGHVPCASILVGGGISRLLHGVVELE